MRPVTFGNCFGWFHQGHGDHGVVLCTAFGAEANTAHRSWRELAVRLAAAGFPTVRFDYSGTGDSPGDGKGPDRIRACLADVHAAVRYLTDATGVEKVTLVGFRFGATLAVACAEQLGGVAGLVLLAPISSGRDYCRELRLLGRLNKGAAVHQDADALEAHGIALTAEVLGELTAFDILVQGPRPAARALVLRTPMNAPDGDIAGRLRAAGVEVQEGDFADQASLRWSPRRVICAVAMIERVANWIASHGDARPAPTSCSGAARISLPNAGETATFFGPAPGLFGVLCRPAQTAASRRPALLFLSPGAETHIGGDRLWVSLARQLAEAGFASLRFDPAGVGDSPAPTANDGRKGHLEHAIVDVRRALDFLENQGFPQVVCVGHCLGGRLACDVALIDSRVKAQVLIGPFLPFSGQDFHTAGRYLREARAVSTWQRLLGGGVPAAKLAQAAGDIVRGLARKMVRLALLRAAPAEAAARQTATLTKRGVDTLLIFGEGDSLYREFLDYYRLDRDTLCKRLRLRLHLLRGIGHAFPREADRRQLATSLLEHLRRASPVSPAAPCSPERGDLDDQARPNDVPGPAHAS